MFCKNCGTPMADDVRFCPNCGTDVSQSTYFNQSASVQMPHDPVPGMQAAPVQDPPSGGVALIFSIIGMLLMHTFFLAIPGIIFSSIGVGRANAYFRITGTYSGAARAARIIGKISQVFNIIFGVIISLLITIALFA